jgi:hypothetical protein
VPSSQQRMRWKDHRLELVIDMMYSTN